MQCLSSAWQCLSFCRWTGKTSCLQPRVTLCKSLIKLNCLIEQDTNSIALTLRFRGGGVVFFLRAWPEIPQGCTARILLRHRKKCETCYHRSTNGALILNHSKEQKVILTKDNKRKFVPNVCQPIDNERSYDAPNITHGRADKNPQVPLKKKKKHREKPLSIVCSKNSKTIRIFF